MDHPNILSYFGSNERFNMKGEREYLLIIAYAPHGCLQEYLSQNTIDFQTFCQMAIGIAKGLAHLHSEINRGSKYLTITAFLWAYLNVGFSVVFPKFDDLDSKM